MSTTSTYIALYTSLADVDRLLQAETTGSTKPNDDDVLHFIEETEAGIQARNLGSTTISGAVFEVKEWNKGTDGVVYAYPDTLPEEGEGLIVVPPYNPIITLSSGFLYKKTDALTGSGAWTLLKEGPGTDTDYILLKRLNKLNGKYLGFGIYFYHDMPVVGYDRLRANITYGENTDSKILQEYATLKVAKKVIMARLFSGQPSNVATYTAGTGFQTYVNTQFEAQMRYIDSRIKEIEDTHFAKKLSYSLMRGV